MAKAPFSQPSVRPRSTALLRSAVVLWTLLGLGLIFSGPAINWMRGFLEYYAGVFTLVLLSITVMVGLVATDRMVLTIRHRILLQAAHRGTALASLTFLGIHITLKVLEAHASAVDIIVPFLASHSVIFIGFGTIASNLMIVIAWTGIVRGRFAGSAHPGIWRALHALSYVSWPFALVHGLESGRQAKTWVIVSYVACVIFVVLALLVRVCLMWGKRRRAPKATTSGTIRAVGKPVPRPEPPRLAPLPPPRRGSVPPRQKPMPVRHEPMPLYQEPMPIRREAPPLRQEPVPIRQESMPLRQEPMPIRHEAPPLRQEPTPLRQEHAPLHQEPAMPVAGRQDEFASSGAREPVSRGRLAKGARAALAAGARPRPGMEPTDPVTPRDRIPEEPVTPPTGWRTKPVQDSGTGDSQQPPRLTFLDETPDERPTSHASWDEPDPYDTPVSPAVGRHSGEYQVLQRADGYLPSWEAAPEPAPVHRYYDESQPHAWAEEPVSAPAKRRRSRHQHEAIAEVTEIPDRPPTRKPAAVLTDEEFWAHMRGDALR